MAVNLNSNLSTKPATKLAFKADDAELIKAEVKTSPLEKQPAKDDFTAPVKMKAPEKAQPNKPKTGPIQGFKNFVAGGINTWHNISGYTKATVMGGATGLGLYGITWSGLKLRDLGKIKDSDKTQKLLAPLRTQLKEKSVKLSEESLKNLDALKFKPSKWGKIAIALAVAAVPVGLSLFNASLRINNKVANTEDHWLGRDNSVKAHK